MGNIGDLQSRFEVLAAEEVGRPRVTVPPSPEPMPGPGPEPVPMPGPEPIPDPGHPAPEPLPGPPSGVNG